MSIAPCSPATVTPGIVVFNPTAFAARYPSFATVTEAALQQNFNQACLMLDNSCCSVVRDAPTREILLNLATAHITALLNGVNGQPPQGVVGRVSQAQEGSVSVQAEFEAKSESAAFWAQSPWGLAFWTATLKYRTARYIPPQHHFGGMDGWPE
jgi:hypothetical protein